MSERDAEQAYGSIIVVGGGCYGGYYVRQLTRAMAAGVVRADRVLVVDRDASCAVANELAAPFQLVVAEWEAFFEEYLVGAERDAHGTARDAIVPSPLMPHLMGRWLVGRARLRFGGRVATRPFERAPDVPWSRGGDDGTHYVSFATWMCPINCIEPRLCPHTRSVRDWSMPERIASHTGAARAAGEAVEDAVLFCRHRAYGVGMFDTAEVLAADARITAMGARGGEMIIGTVSHCHGALTRLVLAPPGGPNDSPIR